MSTNVRLVEMACRRAWAVRPEVLSIIAELLALRLSGDRFDESQIATRIAGQVRPQTARMRPVTAGAVAVLPLQGVLVPKASMLTQVSAATSLAQFRAHLREAVASPQVSAVLIDVDSPGGSVDLVPETAADVRAARSAKPVVAIANTDAASAAYWIASQASELVITPSGMVGSIGVVGMHEDISRALEMRGHRVSLISAGRYKTEANPFEPLGEEARSAIQQLVDEYYRLFTLDVARGRGVRVEQVRAGYGEGRMLTASQALAEGMVDRVETFEQTLRRLGASASNPAPRGPAQSEGNPSIVRARTTGPVTAITVDVGPFAGPIAPHDTEVVDRPWDADREVGEIPNDAGGETLRRMYAWVDDGANPDTKAAYSLPHHEVEAGEPQAANVNGVRNALSRLPQSDIPESDHPGVERHLRQHLDRFNAERSARARARTLRLHQRSRVTGRAGCRKRDSTA